ncbi:hypothetical protein HGB07_04065 [Candidatus Roizmanbacteria bacterium]|nr:hypothetical protein [Candidatus Roizmanbacteria bacterium]
MQLILVLLFVPLFLLFNFCSDGYTANPSAPTGLTVIETTTSITQYGITWTFAEPVGYGQFVNGDYWVVGLVNGVKITGIKPGFVTHPTTGRAMNGSMLNPRDMDQGYDSFRDYDASKNVGIGISPATPLVLANDSSLVSTISNAAPTGNDSYVKTAAVLTCLSSAPAEGSFRPGISTSTKTILSANNLDYLKLQKLAVPPGITVTAATLTTQANALKMVFLDHGGWTTRFIRPSDSGLFSNYYYGFDFSGAALMLNLDFTDLEKRSLLINFIQLGIDLYSFIEAGPTGNLVSTGEPFYGWQPDGGNSNGRKWPILFAGIMLDYSPMKNIGQKSGDYLYSNGHGPGNPPSDYVFFGEDGQTFYVTQADVNLTNGATWNPDPNTAPNFPYTSSMIGMPEWGIKHATRPQDSDAAWTANYRAILTGAGHCWAGDVMAARLMEGGKALWNNNAFFDYIDRYMAISKGGTDPFGYLVPRESVVSRPTQYLAGKMFDTYRLAY